MRGAHVAPGDATSDRRARIPSQIAATAHPMAPHSAIGTITPIHAALLPALGIQAYESGHTTSPTIPRASAARAFVTIGSYSA